MADQKIHYRGSARTHIGQVRESNQDSAYLLADVDFICGAVMDGFGNINDQRQVEQASRIVIDIIEATLKTHSQLFQTLSDDKLTQVLRETLQAANRDMYQKVPTVGSTVTLAFVRESTAIIAHVGNGRAYLINRQARGSTQLTSDHTITSPMLDSSETTSVLYRALGQAEDLDIDIYYKQLEIGDQLLLCTDGLYRHVNADEMTVIALAEKTPDSATQELIDLANDRSGEDNISVIIITIEQEGTDKGVIPDSEK